MTPCLRSFFSFLFCELVEYLSARTHSGIFALSPCLPRRAVLLTFPGLQADKAVTTRFPMETSTQPTHQSTYLCAHKSWCSFIFLFAVIDDATRDLQCPLLRWIHSQSPSNPLLLFFIILDCTGEWRVESGDLFLFRCCLPLCLSVFMDPRMLAALIRSPLPLLEPASFFFFLSLCSDLWVGVRCSMYHRKPPLFVSFFSLSFFPSTFC